MEIKYFLQVGERERRKAGRKEGEGVKSFVG